MMRHLGRVGLAVTVVLACAALFVGCDVGTNPPFRPDYRPRVEILVPGGGPAFGQELLPLSTTSRWIYLTAENPLPSEERRNGSFVQLTVAEEPRARFGHPTWRLVMADGGRGDDLFLAIDDEGIWFHGYSHRVFPSPVLLVPLPARASMSWTTRNDELGLSSSGETGPLEAVATPQGVFEALRTTVNISESKDIELVEGGLTIWLVPGLGIVRQRGLDPFSGLREHWLLRYYELPGDGALRDSHRLDKEAAP